MSAWGIEAGGNIAPGKLTVHGNFYYGKALGQQFAHITQTTQGHGDIRAGARGPRPAMTSPRTGACGRLLEWTSPTCNGSPRTIRRQARSPASRVMTMTPCCASEPGATQSAWSTSARDAVQHRPCERRPGRPKRAVYAVRGVRVRVSGNTELTPGTRHLTLLL